MNTLDVYTYQHTFVSKNLSDRVHKIGTIKFPLRYPVQTNSTCSQAKLNYRLN